MRACGFSRRTGSICGSASRVAVCMGRWKADPSLRLQCISGVEALRERSSRGDVVALGPQPGRGRGEPEWLPAEIVSGNQNDAQSSYYRTL